MWWILMWEMDFFNGRKRFWLWTCILVKNVLMDVFISCLDSHSDGTHSLQTIHWWASDAMLHFSKSDEENKLIYILDSNFFLADFHLWVNYSFKIIVLLSIWPHLEFPTAGPVCTASRLHTQPAAPGKHAAQTPAGTGIHVREQSDLLSI